MSETAGAKPAINVTPLIDVLLVLLIIFMVVSPMKPSAFKAKVPAQPKGEDTAIPNPYSLIVTVNSDSSLTLNKDKDFGTTSDSQKLIAKLSETFQQRLENQAFASGMETRDDLPLNERIQKTVFIKAPRSLSYGEVAKVVDAVKISGASPIGLQIDDLQ